MNIPYNVLDDWTVAQVILKEVSRKNCSLEKEIEVYQKVYEHKYDPKKRPVGYIAKLRLEIKQNIEDIEIAQLNLKNVLNFLKQVKEDV
jgi:phosphosulfolactate phosphohydrolase-like enzyme